MSATLTSAALNGVCSPPVRCSFLPLKEGNSTKAVAHISDGTSFIITDEDGTYLTVRRFVDSDTTIVVGADSPIRPLARSGFSCVSYLNRVFVFGGRAGPQFSNELWSFNPATERWKEVMAKGELLLPGPRANHSAVVYQQYMFIFSGLSCGVCARRKHSIKDITTPSIRPLRVTDFWCFNFETLRWSNLGPISLQVSNSEALLAKICSKLQKQDSTLYKAPAVFYSKGDLPQPRDDYAIALVNKKIYINGGQSNKCASTSPTLADTWSFDLNSGYVHKFTICRKHSKDCFLPRYRHCAFELNGYFTILGGIDENGLLMKRELWVLVPCFETGCHEFFWQRLPYATSSNLHKQSIALSCGVLGNLVWQDETFDDWRQCVRNLYDTNVMFKASNDKLVEELHQAKTLLTKAVVRASVSKAKDVIEKRHNCVICMIDEAEVSVKTLIDFSRLFFFLVAMFVHASLVTQSYLPHVVPSAEQMYNVAVNFDSARLIFYF